MGCLGDRSKEKLEKGKSEGPTNTALALTMVQLKRIWIMFTTILLVITLLGNVRVGMAWRPHELLSAPINLNQPLNGFLGFFWRKKRLETCYLRLFDNVGQGPTLDRKGKNVMSDQLPSLQYGLTLWFEGYELGRANYNQACTQGQDKGPVGND
ncbi:UNVERIFIED_CONTAM: hypothetical protein FKN15_020632 [Acipenser sinensis]